MLQCAVVSPGKASHVAPARVSLKRSSTGTVQKRITPVRCHAQDDEVESVRVTRRSLGCLCGAGFMASMACGFADPAEAVQGLTAGRIPGVSASLDEEGFYTYVRPEGKSGGHGVGWSEIPQYSFKLPEGWKEEPVSIADLGGTEIDLRFGNTGEGQLFVVVAPILRFMDIGFNADIRIEEIGPPTNLIEGFAPELFGRPLEEDDVLDTKVAKHEGLTYYMWDVRPHRLVTATAYKNRLFILGTESNSRQWRRGQDGLRTVQESFRVPMT
ncbi:hypothetical protein BSKO_01169 [Bryopsis sp. KO-2023]|nr:hypothetical protein BSKO_01169 [Bryopsis sp. KO-2023]